MRFLQFSSQQCRSISSGWLFVIALCLMWSQMVNAKTVTVVAGAWGNFSRADGSGLYFDVLREVLAQSDIDLQIRVTNWKRAKQMFYGGRADVLLADYRGAGDRRYVPRWHLNMDPPVLLFSLQPIADLNLLQGKAVGWMLGYDFGEYLPVAVNGIEVSEEKFGFEMLHYGRLDAYISYAENVPEEFRKSLFDQQLVAEQALYPIFHNDFAGRQLAADFDRGMQRLYKSGRLQQLYLRYAQPPYLPPAQ